MTWTHNPPTSAATITGTRNRMTPAQQVANKTALPNGHVHDLDGRILVHRPSGNLLPGFLGYLVDSDGTLRYMGEYPGTCSLPI